MDALKSLGGGALLALMGLLYVHINLSRLLN